MNIPKEAIEKAIKGGWKSKRDFMRKPQLWLVDPKLGQSVCFIKSKGLEYRCIVDNECLPLVSKYRWYLKDGYAVTSIGAKRAKLHHLLLGKMEEGEVTDHIDRNRLNNCSENLRIVPQGANAKNRMGAGIRRHGNGWEASICHDYRQIYLGTFATQKQAAEAYSRAKRAQLNAI